MSNIDYTKMSAMEKVLHATADMDNSRKNTLDDEQRIKVLSPGMLVVKRFFRNRLAICGLVILVIMFLFSFVGPIFTPYTQTQPFTKESYEFKPFASAKYSNELYTTTKDGKNLAPSVNTKFLLAKAKGNTLFKDGDADYSYDQIGENLFVLNTFSSLGNVFIKGAIRRYSDNELFTDTFKKAFELAISENKESFDFEGKTYILSKDGNEISVGSMAPYAIMTKNIYYSYSESNKDLVNNFDFKIASEKAIIKNLDSFTFDTKDFTIEKIENTKNFVIKNNGEDVALISNIVVSPLNKQNVLPMSLITSAIEALNNGQKSIDYVLEETGEKKLLQIFPSSSSFDIRTEQLTKLDDTFAPPSKEHLLGTDEKAFDLLTRLMYGGRISLMVGFVVVFLEIFIGIIFGGISGYFGGIVDLLLMRFIDLFNSIPSFPLMIILGSVMDTLEVPSTERIFLLMLLLGLLGWTGIARVVRGQILTLREQDFMVATESTGLSVSKRIFRHLVPNVMPLLIVQATLSLGGIIITEATLSFLGLGVKPPLASWGSIINAANDIYVMKTSWWIWIPAGVLIVLTVLGFNFVGDGLRDAYDPKMKR